MREGAILREKMASTLLTGRSHLLQHCVLCWILHLRVTLKQLFLMFLEMHIAYRGYGEIIITGGTFSEQFYGPGLY